MRLTKWYPFRLSILGKNGRKAVKFFKVIIEKTFFDHNPGYFQYFDTLNIPKSVELNFLQLSKLVLRILSYTTENNQKKMKKLRNIKIKPR